MERKFDIHAKKITDALALLSIGNIPKPPEVINQSMSVRDIVSILRVSARKNNLLDISSDPSYKWRLAKSNDYKRRNRTIFNRQYAY
jgi:hypothetical protein